MAMTIISVNVKSVKSRWLRDAVLQELGDVNADVFCLQECGVDRWPGVDEFSSACESQSEGVRILVKNPNIKIISHEVVISGRVLVVHYLGVKVCIVNCYTPAEKRERKEVFWILKLYVPGRMATFLKGDFNCVRKTTEREGVGQEGEWILHLRS